MGALLCGQNKSEFGFLILKKSYFSIYHEEFKILLIVCLVIDFELG